MPAFRVTFLKTLSDSTGHDHQICQRRLELDATDRASALAEAQAIFCRLEKVSCWSNHADALKVDCLDQ